jgi:hypothetical protein
VRKNKLKSRKILVLLLRFGGNISDAKKKQQKKAASDFRSVAKTWRYFVARCMCFLKRGKLLSLCYPFRAKR